MSIQQQEFFSQNVHNFEISLSTWSHNRNGFNDRISRRWKGRRRRLDQMHVVENDLLSDLLVQVS